MDATYIKNWVEKPLEKLEINIDYDDFFDWKDDYWKDEAVKICIQPHRHYTFLNELEIDWEWIYEEDKKAIKDYEKLDKKYYCFNLDFFDHGAIAFNLVLDRIDLGYYERDRARNVWIIAIDKLQVKSGKDALELARKTIEDYNHLINWRVYRYDVQEDGDFYDWCGGFLSKEGALDEAKYSIECYLKNKNIEYDEVKIQ